MDVEIGSNLYRNTDGTIEVEGVPQITVGVRKPGGPLQVSFVVYDQDGRMKAKLVDSSLAFNQSRAFDVEKTPTSLVLKDMEARKIALKVEMKDGERIVIPLADFLTIKAHRFEVFPTEWRLDKQQKSGEETDLKGGRVVVP